MGAASGCCRGGGEDREGLFHDVLGSGEPSMGAERIR